MMWKEKYVLGEPIIDQQHKELFKRVDHFVETLRSPVSWEEKAARVKETLEFMQLYVVEHFRDEEAYQKSIGYQGYEEHKRLHDEMVNYVKTVSGEYETGGCSEFMMQQFAGKLMAWLVNHVATEDQNIWSGTSGTLKFNESFFEAVHSVFKQMLGLSDMDECSGSGFTYPDDIGVSVKVIGDYEGQIIYRFPKEVAIDIVKILSGMEVTVVDEFVISAISEIANIISGNVLTVLSEKKICCDILPPELYVQEDNQQYAECTDCCISMSIGEVCICIRLNPVLKPIS